MVSLSKALPKASTAPRRFEIMGVFGSGKTTLTHKLVEGQGMGLFESHENNPFWGRPAELEIAGYLPYDLAFLVNHSFLCATHIASDPYSFAVSDWSYITDRLWASMRLGSSLNEYLSIWSEVASQAGPPAGYIYLQVPPAEIIERMKFRGRPPERDLYPFIETAAEKLEIAVDALPCSNVLRLDGTQALEESVTSFAEWSEISKPPVSN